MTRLALALVVTMALLLGAQACDPELTTDFYLSSGTNSSNITGAYFTDTALRAGVSIVSPAKFGIKKINSESFTALTGLGISAALLKYLPGGINPPHTHPRGTELLAVVAGKLNVGLIDSNNKLYTQVLKRGDLFVFPRGLVHYQINLSNKTAMAYASFSSSNPGTISLPGNLFGSGISDVVLETAFEVSENVIDELEAPFAS